MTLGVLYDKLNYYSGKDKRGKTFKAIEFNTLLPTVQDKLYADELGKLVVGDLQPIHPSRLAASPLRVFQKDAQLLVDDGVFPLPSDYVRFISLQNVSYRDIDILTQREFNRRRTSVLRRPSVRPFCYFMGTDIYFTPANSGNVTLFYFRTPTMPYYDYCQDADTLAEIFMPVGSTIVYNTATSQSELRSGSTVLNANVTRDDITVPSLPSGGGQVVLLYTSVTVELEWEAIYHDEFVLAMLALVGINIDKAELTQYAEARKQ